MRWSTWLAFVALSYADSAVRIVVQNPGLLKIQPGAVEVVQKQMGQHFSPEWKIPVVLRYTAGTDVRPGEWVMLVQDEPEQSWEYGLWGYHDVSRVTGTPQAKIFLGPMRRQGAMSDAYVIGHEVMEMAANPYVDLYAVRFTPANYEEMFYREIVDPVQARSYVLDGVRVADFTLPAFWSGTPAADGRYDFLGFIKEPFGTTKADGYLPSRIIVQAGDGRYE